MKRFALFLIFLFVLSAVPVKAQTTSYYMLSFDGVGDYGMVNSSSSLDSITTELTIVAVVQDYNTTDLGNIIARGGNKGWRARIDATKPWFLVSDGSTIPTILRGNTQIAEGRVYMLAFSVKVNGYMKIYVNGQLDASAPYTLDAIGGQGVPVFIGAYFPGVEHFKGIIYLVLVYNRQLSDEEIQQIYNDPLNPPTSGLVVWYAPDSVDPGNGLWKDKSGNGNDGTLVGATAERVSIPKQLYVYDAITLNPIPYLDVSVTLIANNTTTGLIPSMPVLPYNETVTLNVSATNYESRILSTWSGVELISVYLEPVPNGTTSTVPIQPTTTPTFAPIELQNDFGFLGAQQGAKFVAGKWSEAFNEFWTISPMYSLILPVLFTLGLIFAGYMVSRNPLVPIGITAVTATFFGLIDVPLSISIVSPLAAFVLFLVVWALWDFYKHYERS